MLTYTYIMFGLRLVLSKVRSYARIGRDAVSISLYFYKL